MTRITLISLTGKVTWINSRKGFSFSSISVELYCGSVKLRFRNLSSLSPLYLSVLKEFITNLHSILDQRMLFDSFIWALTKDNSTYRLFFPSNLPSSSLCCLQAWKFWRDGLLAQLNSCFSKAKLLFVKVGGLPLIPVRVSPSAFKAHWKDALLLSRKTSEF